MVTTISDYKGVKQRWLLFFSEAAYHRECKTLDKKIQWEDESQNKAWWHLSNRIFTCKDDAFNIVEMKKHASKGRPKAGERPETVGYQIEFSLSLNEEKIVKMRSRKGRFVLATNQLDENILPNETVLSEYKAQSGTERGFKFIKDDRFQVDSVFLKTPERIDALMMVMTLCLMVYGVSEYELHQSLQEKEETIPSQTKKPTNNHIQTMVVNLDGVLRKIIKHFGKRANEIYLNPAGAVS